MEFMNNRDDKTVNKTRNQRYIMYVSILMVWGIDQIKLNSERECIKNTRSIGMQTSVYHAWLYQTW